MAILGATGKQLLIFNLQRQENIFQWHRPIAVEQFFFDQYPHVVNINPMFHDTQKRTRNHHQCFYLCRFRHKVCGIVWHYPYTQYIGRLHVCVHIGHISLIFPKMVKNRKTLHFTWWITKIYNIRLRYFLGSMLSVHVNVHTRTSYNHMH